MLLTLPAEIQTEVCKYLPRRDLASVARVCSNLSAVAVRILYEHVELHSFHQAEAFFHLGTSPIAIKGSDAKRIQWELIKTLDIIIAPVDGQRTLGELPASLSGPSVGPLELDRLRLTYEDDAVGLIPLLKCLNPTKLGLCRTGDTLTHADDRWIATIPSWANVTHVTFGWLPSPLPIRVQSRTDTLDPAFPQAISARLLLPRDALSASVAFFHLSGVIVQLCPNLAGVEIRCDEVRRSENESLVTAGAAWHGSGGKPASFWSIVIKPDGSNIWGDVEEGDA